MFFRLKLLLILLCAAFLGIADVCEAVIMQKGGLRVQAKVQTMGIWRTTSAPDTNPIPITGGDLVQQRNTVMLEWDHQLGNIIGDLGFHYYLQPRAFYDGVWDYGPSEFSDEETREKYGFYNQDQIDDLKKDLELFIGYGDLTFRDAFLRVGRQVFQWGEMSTIRILDDCIPVDYQSLGVDLEERLVPMDLVRGSYTIFDVGPFASMSFEGYYIPGSIDDKWGADFISGSHIDPPIGRRSGPSPLSVVENYTDDDRFGVRIGAMIGELQLYLAAYRKYSDAPAVRYIQPMKYGFPSARPYLEKVIEPVDVYGGSFNYYLASVDSVLRGEFGYFKDTPLTYGGLLGPAINAGHPVPLPPGFPSSYYITSGDVHHHDVIKWGIAVDKDFVFQTLNPWESFRTTVEFINRSIMDYDSKMTYPWPDPETGQPITVDRNDFSVVSVISTRYFDTKLNPRITLIYDISTQTFMCLPAIDFSNGGYLHFEIGYQFTASGTYEGMGYLKNNDEVTLKLTYYF